MSRIEKRVRVQPAVERVFAYVPEATGSPEIWPGLLEVGEVELLPGGGAIARWVYRLSGAIITNTSDQTGPLVDRRHTSARPGNVACLMEWNFHVNTDTPHIALDADYTYWSMC